MVRLLCDADGNRDVYSLCCLCKNLIAIRLLNSDLKSRLDVSHYISGSITAYADTCPIGLTVVVTGNDTTQMAGMTSRYTIGFVLNRASDSGVVILFSYSNNEIYMISKNETWDSKVSAK